MNRSLIIFVLTFILPYALLFSEDTHYALVFPLFFVITWNSLGQIIITNPLDALASVVMIQMKILFGVPYLVLCFTSAWQVNRVHTRDTEQRKGVLSVLAGTIIIIGYFLVFSLISLQFMTTYHGAVGPVPIPLTAIVSLLLMVKQNTFKTNAQ